MDQRRVSAAEARFAAPHLPREHGGEVGLQVAALRLEAGCMDEVSGERRLLASTWPAGAPAQPPEEGGHQRPLHPRNTVGVDVCALFNIPAKQSQIEAEKNVSVQGKVSLR